MNRSQRRLAVKNKSTANYTIPKQQINKIKSEATEEALNTAFTLLMSIPVKVACEKYNWSDEDLEGFANDICDEYAAFQNGEMTIQELQDYVYKHCGLKFAY